MRLIHFRGTNQREKSQGRETDSVDSKYLERQALRNPVQDRHDNWRSAKHDSDERLENQKFTGYFQEHANRITGKVEGYHYNTHTRLHSKMH